MVKKPLKYPFFRFSKGVDSVEELEGWFRHFRARDIPCCIVVEQGVQGEKFTLWRVGEDRFYGEDRNREEIIGRTIRKYDPENQFRKNS